MQNLGQIWKSRFSISTKWCEIDNQVTTPFDYCPSTVSPVWPHHVNARWYRCQDLNSFPFVELEETMFNIILCGQRLSSNNTWNPITYLNEAIVFGSKPSTLETDVNVWHYALLVVHGWMDGWMDGFVLCFQWWWVLTFHSGWCLKV